MPEVRVLGRVITWCNWGLQLEADPGHRELIIDALNLRDAKSVVSPGETDGPTIKAKDLTARRRNAHARDINEEVQEEEEGLLQGERAKDYASIAARSNYLGPDRPDLQFVSKELMRKLGQPNESDEKKLKRMGRYLIGAKRLVCRFPWKKISRDLHVSVDSNHAGCHRTRMSTVGGVILWDGACLKTWSKTVKTFVSLQWGVGACCNCERYCGSVGNEERA